MESRSAVVVQWSLSHDPDPDGLQLRQLAPVDVASEHVSLPYHQYGGSEIGTKDQTSMVLWDDSEVYR